MAESIIWTGKSGKEYKYWIHSLDDTHDAAPANYIFVNKTRPTYYRLVYIGETEDISQRFDSHHKMPCIRRIGITHLCTHKSDTDKKVRCAEEADLISNYNPICNDLKW
jgi:predicted GIY-YIG superfamily endonuclease